MARARFVRRMCCVAAGLVLCLLNGTAFGVEIKLASIAPAGSHWLNEMRAGAQRIEELTDGRVQFQFYPGGVMGDDVQVLRKVRVGQLHGGAFTAGGLSERYSALNLYGMPLLFRSLDEVDYVRERMDPILAAGLREAGFVSFGFVEGGFANLLSNEPISSVEDLRRKKVWIPEGDTISFLAMEALGLSPVVLPVTDVLTGLQTGLLDVAAASPVAVLVLQWHTKVQYLTDLPVSYSMGVFAISSRTFDRLQPSDQRTVRQVMSAVMDDLDRAAREDNRRARQVLYESGIEPVAVDRHRVDDWRAEVQSIYPQLRQRPDVDGALLDTLLELLAEYRANGSAAPHRE